MKTILFIINYYHRGGPSRVVLNIIKSLNRKKYKIQLMTISNLNDRESINELKKMNVEIIEMNNKKSILTILKNRNSIINKIKELNPDVIHTHCFLSTLIVSTMKTNSKKIVTLHNNMYEDYILRYGKIIGSIYIFLQKRSLRNFNYNICCSKSVYDSLKNKVNNLYYVRNGIDPELPNYKISKNIRKELNIPDDSIIFTYCGSLNKRKRILELTKMFSNNLNEGEYFLIIGARGMLDEIKKYENNQIRVLGFKNNVMDYYSISDVYVSFSSSEGFSISIIEALNQGLPLLLSNIPSHNEVLDIDKSIYLGEIFDENNFKTKKDKIINNITKNTKDKIKKFQSDNISSKAMTLGYEYYYNL